MTDGIYSQNIPIKIQNSLTKTMFCLCKPNLMKTISRLSCFNGKFVCLSKLIQINKHHHKVTKSKETDD